MNRHAGLRRAGLAHDLVGPDSVGHQKHDVCSPDVLLRAVMFPGDRFKPMAIWSCDLDGNSGANASDSHARPLERRKLVISGLLFDIKGAGV
jgi:hypothetical protein